MMRPFRAAVLGTLLLGSSCTDDGARQLFDTAQLEEKQNNHAHAKELYQQISAKYPHSEYARNAEERLRVLSRNQ
jgi:outer membrane protein assembly factor BamD (BamD/ComL family)